MNGRNSQYTSRTPARRRKRSRLSDLLLFLFLLLFPTVSAGALGAVLFRAGYVPSFISANLTATSVAKKNAGCQALIERAMQASESSCRSIGSNTACYGNQTIDAVLAPDTLQQFSQRGDIVGVDQVRSISASPLLLDHDEWGIAFFNLIANLPRSLPGQTVMMIVFGDTTLENASGNLETFFFTSELGRIVCDKMPDDGIMLTVPNGGGIRFTVNGAQLSLAGDASMKAARNGKMEVSLFEGAGSIISGGKEVFFGAGTQVSVQLGGPNGTESVGPPSEPVLLSQDALDTACALTGLFCSMDEITFVPLELAQQFIMQMMGIPVPPTIDPSTPTPVPPPTETPTPTSTLFIFPSWTPSATQTKAATLPPPVVNTPLRTPTPRRTPTRTFTPPPSASPVPTETFTAIPSPTPVTPTATTPPVVACNRVKTGDMAQKGSSLAFTITNDLNETITLNSMRVVWLTTVDGTPNRILDQLLEGNQIGNANSTESPSEFPSPNPFVSNVEHRQIQGNETRKTLTVNFENPPLGTGYTVQLGFSNGCTLEVSR